VSDNTPEKIICQSFFQFFLFKISVSYKSPFFLLTNFAIRCISIEYEQGRSFLQQIISALKMDALAFLFILKGRYKAYED